MGLIAVPGAGPLLFPGGYGSRTGAAPATSQVSLAASGARVAFIVRCPKAGVLDKFEWMNNVYSGTNTVRHSFQDIDLATGFPDGGVDQFRTFNPTSATWVDPGLITSDGTDTGTKRTVAQGELLACVVDFSAYTSGGANPRVIADTTQNFQHYVASFNGATWSNTLAIMPCLALKYEDGTYGLFRAWIWPISVINTRAINTGTTPDEIGVKFQVPWDCVVEGAQLFALPAENLDVVLYDENDTVLATASWDKEIEGTAVALYFAIFPSAVTLSRNTTYRLVVKPATATNVSVYDATVASVALMAAMLGGANWVMTERTNAGAWTDTTTRVPIWTALLITQIGDGAPNPALALSVSDGLR